jgi:hypothetical protein
LAVDGTVNTQTGAMGQKQLLIPQEREVYGIHAIIHPELPHRHTSTQPLIFQDRQVNGQSCRYIVPFRTFIANVTSIHVALHDKSAQKLGFHAKAGKIAMCNAVGS